jgi:hypothetical protein
VKVAVVPALLASAYMLAAAWRHGAWRTVWLGWFGPLWLGVLLPASEFLFWIGAAFALGYFWHQLPGRRGFVKPIPLVAAYALGIGAKHFLLRVLDQTRPQGAVTRILLMLVVLTAVAVLIDLRVLDAIRSPWTGRLAPLIGIYRVGTASTTLAFLLTQAAAIFGLWQQLRTGAGVSQPSSPPPTTNR